MNKSKIQVLIKRRLLKERGIKKREQKKEYQEHGRDKGKLYNLKYGNKSRNTHEELMKGTEIQKSKKASNR